MKVNIELTESDIKKLVKEHIEDLTGFQINPDQLRIEVRSKQNFKPEWEDADFHMDFRAVYKKSDPS